MIPREAVAAVDGYGHAIRLAPCPEGRVPVAICDCYDPTDGSAEAGCPSCGGLGYVAAKRFARVAVRFHRCSCAQLRAAGQSGPQELRYSADPACALCGGSGITSVDAKPRNDRFAAQRSTVELRLVVGQ